jgi:dUTP pyrophosphatase
MKTEIKIINKSNNQLPNYQTPGSSGLDLRANIDETIEIKPFDRVLVPTGLFLEIPLGLEAQIRPRSGLALKQGITVLNSPGTIDADYRGEIQILLINLSNQPVFINHGDRIAQMVFAKIEQVAIAEVNSISNSERGSGGFGSTGIS